MRSDRNVAASHSIVSCRVNAAQPSGNPASAVKYPGALPSSSYPPDPTLRAATPLAHLGPAFPSCSLALASLLSPARLRTRRHGLPTQSRSHFLNSRASQLDPCLPPAPLPAKARRPARPSRMPAHLGPSRLRPTSLDPHARALQLGPRVPNHPRSDPPPHMPTHLGPSLFPSSPRLPERATRRRRRRNCEPGPAYSQLGGGATPPWSGAGSYGAGRSSNCPLPVTTFTVVVVAGAARGCQSAAPPGFTGNENSPLTPPLPLPGPARQDRNPGQEPKIGGRLAAENCAHLMQNVPADQKLEHSGRIGVHSVEQDRNILCTLMKTYVHSP
jgi:hypothetical protein